MKGSGIVTLFLFMLLLVIGIALAMLLLLIPSQEKPRITKTGETFEERARYHRRGELSPGEHALARMIREGLQRNEEKQDE